MKTLTCIKRIYIVLLNDIFVNESRRIQISLKVIQLLILRFTL